MDNNDKKPLGITFTGPITVNGPMFDIHDNQHVYITHPGQSVDTQDPDQGEPQAASSKRGRPKRTGKTINKSFLYDAGSETNARLQYLYNGLMALGWIKPGTDLRSFLCLFSGKETTSRVVWTGEVNTLAELFRELVSRRQLVQLPKGVSLWVMVNARFWKKEGNHEFGNDRLSDTRTPIEMKDKIDLLVSIMNPDYPVEKVKRVLQSQG